MNLLEFEKSLADNNPPEDLRPVLVALWYDHKGNWTKAHDVAQDIPGPDGSLIHAYLHRKEGDIWNARYWYQKAGSEMPDASLEDEWRELVKSYLT
ncbi:MAG: hypothetical protein HKN76_02705 [Saprospiraceae bacterium]|nr:hypothetical protein [Saprospiraceae bacterium]